MARWTLIAAVLAPVSLVSGWLVAQSLQPVGYHAVDQTISVLAGGESSHRWVMSVALYTLGALQILTAVGLGVLQPVARIMLAVGGVTGLGVATFPLPPHGTGVVHLTFATSSIVLLSLWPAVVGWRASTGPRVLTWRGSLLVTVLFLSMLGWLYVAAHGGGALGIAERVVTAIENAWPLAVILAISRHTRRLGDDGGLAPLTRTGTVLG